MACTPAPDGAPPTAEYDPETGRLVRLDVDLTRNGTRDSVSVMDGSRVVRVELDLDENGHAERWDFYTPDRTLEKVGFASRNDGVMDSVAFYDPTGSLERIEVSTRRDGVFDRLEFYADWRLERSQEDTNGDGRPDKWETYRLNTPSTNGQQTYSVASAAFDHAGLGVPTLRFTYGESGEVVLVERDTDGKGLQNQIVGHTTQ